ncbi:MAG: 4'-phosphopantetheinyl transferase superfamily protein [Ruminococcus sp.]|nr:4'-phosphopantetheinyl transferase superfamily protein [uncultured Ruminococcus sp.]MBQ1349096.1 4'-phosphopantetheinyl transferase superfamily protein [Ruminococcus sp.]MBQ4170942.1 4'-phosphopantetheinyl transferase superfamily protein [Ruminococcus sp.]MBQ4261788.1 4'-phosphopantetheinyl transferase superfamily protein [Ruminococcus sp.]
MKIYLADIASVLPRHREYISPQRLQKTLRYRMPDDQKRCIAGSVLLRYFLGDTAILDNGFGKPVAENGVCFNLSHSGGWVLLAVDDRDVGCDIESVCFVDAARMGKIVFTGRECRMVETAPDKTGVFFDLWTKKEALLKCMGKGFHREAKSVEVCGDRFADGEITYYMKTKRFADYTVSVCSVNPDFQMKVEFVDLKSIG